MADWIVEMAAEVEGEALPWEARYKVDADRFRTVKEALDEGSRRAWVELGDRPVTRMTATILQGLQSHTQTEAKGV